MQNLQLVRIRNRKLEQFLHIHGIRFFDTGKDFDGITWWDYEKTEWFDTVVNEYKYVTERIMKK